MPGLVSTLRRLGAQAAVGALTLAASVLMLEGAPETAPRATTQTTHVEGLFTSKWPAKVPAAASAAARSPLDPARAPPPTESAADKLVAEVFADPIKAGQLLYERGFLLAAATKDAAAAGESLDEYLSRLEDLTASFFKKLEKDGLPIVINHDATLAALGILGRSAGEGQLIAVTGARSVGKSLMLKKVAAALKAQGRHVVIFDARQHGTDIVRGIVTSLTADAALLKAVLQAAPATVAAGIARLALKLAPRVLGAGIELVLDAAANIGLDHLNAEVSLGDLLGALFKACADRGEYPIIIIDEANKALAARDETARARTLDLLDLLTRVSKQQREASVVLATSDYGLPYRLRALGYNTDHIRRTIVAEEVPPAVMKGMLMGQWGCGEHLANALLMLYGGHVLHASEAISLLAAATPARRSVMQGFAALGTITSAPAGCLSDRTFADALVPAGQWAGMREHVHAALVALAKDGFVPLDSEDDKVAEVISLANAGLIVRNTAEAASVPLSAWASRTPKGNLPKFVLVPSSHIMRLLIASEVFPPPLDGATAAPLA